jgi:hypothetical protein
MPVFTNSENAGDALVTRWIGDETWFTQFKILQENERPPHPLGRG